MQLVFEERSSKGVVKDFYSTNYLPTTQTKEPPYVYRVLMDMAEADPILFTALSLTVDLTTYKGFDFEGKNSRAIERARELFYDKFDFDQVIDNVLWQVLVYGDAYLELRWNESHTEIVELHPLETSEMSINYDEHGDIKGYVQKVSSKGPKEYVHFAPDEVIYFRLYWVGSEVYSRSPFKAIARPYASKIYANNYLQSIFNNLPPKLVYFLKNANRDERKLFVENLIQAKNNPNIDIVAQGEAFESKMMEVRFDNGLVQVLEYLRQEVLTITRVPPHWVGILDGANRGIGENVVIPFETKIKKLQQKIASQINRELMPKLGLTNVEFCWNAISLMDEKSIVEIMNFLKAQMFDSETIIQYGREHGLNLREGAYIETPPIVSSGSGSQTLLNKTSLSRLDKNAKTNKMGSGMDKKGVSAAGKERLEQKKVM